MLFLGGVFVDLFISVVPIQISAQEESSLSHCLAMLVKYDISCPTGQLAFCFRCC